MTELLTKLQQAEAKANALLDEMNGVDALLSTLTPADPARTGLKAKKADLLPRYRGAKEQVKTLRRMINSTAPAAAPPVSTPVEADVVGFQAPTLGDVLRDGWIIPQNISTNLYDVLHGLLDRHHSTPSRRGPVLMADEVGPITAFLEWYEADGT